MQSINRLSRETFHEITPQTLVHRARKNQQKRIGRSLMKRRRLRFKLKQTQTRRCWRKTEALRRRHNYQKTNFKLAQRVSGAPN